MNFVDIGRFGRVKAAFNVVGYFREGRNEETAPTRKAQFAQSKTPGDRRLDGETLV